LVRVLIPFQRKMAPTEVVFAVVLVVVWRFVLVSRMETMMVAEVLVFARGRDPGAGQGVGCCQNPHGKLSCASSTRRDP
jgi:hypothetical protein